GGAVGVSVLWWIYQLSVRCQPRSSMEHEKVSLQQLFISSSTDSSISTIISTTLSSSSVYIEIPLVDR
ncbi:hypothetical protein M501DRAFT_999364, partial [Patellaria atrata CBS 101060]